METVGKILSSAFGQKGQSPDTEHTARTSDHPASAEGQKYRSAHPQTSGPEQVVMSGANDELSSPGYSKAGSTSAAPGTGLDRSRHADVEGEGITDRRQSDHVPQRSTAANAPMFTSLLSTDAHTKPSSNLGSQPTGVERDHDHSTSSRPHQDLTQNLSGNANSSNIDESRQHHRGTDSLVKAAEEVTGAPTHHQSSGVTHAHHQQRENVTLPGSEPQSRSDPLRSTIGHPRDAPQHPVAGQGQGGLPQGTNLTGHTAPQRSTISSSNEPTGFAGQTQTTSVRDTANPVPSSVAGIGGGPGFAVEPSVGAHPAHGMAPQQKHQGAERPNEAPAPGHLGRQSGEHSGSESGTGEKYVRSTGMAAEGGDFDAARPGAGREADRLLEQKGIHRTVDKRGHPTTDDHGHHGTDDHSHHAGSDEHHKKGLGEKIKELIHGKHHDH